MTQENILATIPDGEPVISKEMAEAAEAAGVITAPNKPGKGGKTKSSFGGVANNNVIGSAGASKPAKPAAKAGPKKATVAIYSDRNVSWSGVGTISKGYNIVEKDQAEKWLTRKHVREATPEEVASEYGA
jgi:hypothetical protein